MNATFFVEGTPAPQGSKSAFAVRTKDGTPTGQINVRESSKAVKPWRKTVAAVAARHRGPVPAGHAASVSLVFYIKRPKSHYRTGKFAHLLRDDAPMQHTQKPDLDKLIRSTLDALTTAGVYPDDSAVAQFGQVSKHWAAPEFAEHPGAKIGVLDLGPAVLRTTPRVA
jgi:Holliday junction resolvase RusA-like endonuclease